jgi:hypothetical protein
MIKSEIKLLSIIVIVLFISLIAKNFDDIFISQAGAASTQTIVYKGK